MRRRGKPFAGRGFEFDKKRAGQGFVWPRVARHRLGELYVRILHTIKIQKVPRPNAGAYACGPGLTGPAIRTSPRNCQFVLRCPSGPGAFPFASDANGKSGPKWVRPSLLCLPFLKSQHFRHMQNPSPVSLSVLISCRFRSKTIGAVIQQAIKHGPPTDGSL